MSTGSSDDDGGNSDPQGPPRLPPASGVLIQGSKGGLVRPVAFKPVLGFHSPAVSEESGVAELEGLLRDRDAEIAYLRETLEHNEQVIFRVHAEKERAWTQKVNLLKAQLESRLVQSSQENIRLQVALAERDQKIESLHKQMISLEALTEWNLSQKTGEIALLRDQLKKSHSVEDLRAQLKDLRATVEEKEVKINELKDKLKQETTVSQFFEKELTDLRTQYEESLAHLEDKSKVLIQQKLELEVLGTEVAAAKLDSIQARQQFEEDRLRWQEEKDKVIKYQKHLQQNYVHIYRKNLYLRNEVENLTLEMVKDSARSHCGESHC